LQLAQRNEIIAAAEEKRKSGTQNVNTSRLQGGIILKGIQYA
jgi:hypothetical protein